MRHPTCRLWTLRAPRLPDAPHQSSPPEPHPAPAHAPPSLWSCPTCTYDNRVQSRACDMCGTPNPAPFPSAAPDPMDAMVANAIGGERGGAGWVRRPKQPLSPTF